jgi:hypothetical protein
MRDVSDLSSFKRTVKNQDILFEKGELELKQN